MCLVSMPRFFTARGVHTLRRSSCIDTCIQGRAFGYAHALTRLLSLAYQQNSRLTMKYS